MLDLLVKITLARASLRQHRPYRFIYCRLRDDRSRSSDTIHQMSNQRAMKRNSKSTQQHHIPSSAEASCIVYEMLLCRKYPEQHSYERCNSARDAREIPNVNFGHHCLWRELILGQATYEQTSAFCLVLLR